MHLFHKWGSWGIVRRGELGENNVGGAGFEGIVAVDPSTKWADIKFNPQAGEIGCSGDYIVQERKCYSCNLIQLHRQEVFE